MSESGLVVEKRNTCISILNCMTITWKHISIKDPLEFYYKSTLIPIFKENED